MRKKYSSESNLVKKKINFYDDIQYIHQLNPIRYPFLLQSAARGNSLCRYDILFAFPQKEIILNYENIKDKKNDFLKKFDTEWKKENVKIYV